MCVTCEEGSVASQESEIVHEGCEDPLHGPEHGAEAQVEQHEEEQRGPEGAGGEQRHHLGERDESQSRPFHTLWVTKIWYLHVHSEEFDVRGIWCL